MMSMTSRFVASAFSLLVAAESIPFIARADIPIATGTAAQHSPAVVADGAGGAVIVWAEGSPREQLLARHITSNGSLDPGWSKSPVLVSPSSGDASDPVAANDSKGGAFVVWSDARSGRTRLMGAHVTSTGAIDPSWSPHFGVGAVTQTRPIAVPEAAGGVLVVWAESRGGIETGWVALRLGTDGKPASGWPETGVRVVSAPGLSVSPEIVPQLDGGAIVAWMQRGVGAAMRVRVLRLDGGGVVRTDPAGLEPSNAAGEQVRLAACADGIGGAFLAWQGATATGVRCIYLQHLDAAAQVDRKWPSSALIVRAESRTQRQPGLTSDGAGGVVIAWTRSDLQGGDEVEVAHVTLGAKLDPSWPGEPLALGAPGVHREAPWVGGDGVGGAFLVWHDRSRPFEPELLAAHILADGRMDESWNAPIGSSLCAAAGDRSDLTASSGAGLAAFAWVDWRAGSPDVYAALLTPQGPVEPVRAAATAAVLSFDRPYPTPSASHVTLRFYLPTADLVDIRVFDIAGREIQNVEHARYDPGWWTVRWDGRSRAGNSVHSGVYFAALRVGGKRLTRRIVIAR
jgi:hypothetical protein